jgi:hypothetical protein
MTSLSRDINDTARAFCSTKNELLVVMALTNQTIGYGKISDPLTDKRLAKITGIRLDRLRPAINAVIGKGLFDRKPHKRYGHEYSIGADFLQAYPDKVYTPSISPNNTISEKQNPIFGNNADLTQMGKPLTEKRRHTITNPTSSQPQQTKTKKIIKKQPQQNQSVPLAEQQKQHQEKQSVKLFFNDENAIPSSFAIETSSANTRIEFSFGTPLTRQTETPHKTDAPLTRKTEIHPKADAPLTRKTETRIADEQLAITTPKVIKTLKKAIQAVKTEKTDKTDNIEKPTTRKKPPKPRPLANMPLAEHEPWVVDALAAADHLDRVEEEAKQKAKEQQETKKTTDTHPAPVSTPKPIPVDPPIKTATAVVCGGDDDNKKDEKPEETIPLPTIVGEENYNACNRHFNVLDNELKKKLVMVFNYNLKTRIVNNPAGYFITLAKTTAEDGLTVPPEAIVHQPLTPKQQAVAKEKANHAERWGDFAWLQQSAELQKMDIETLGKQMGGEMDEAYTMFAHTLKQAEE